MTLPDKPQDILPCSDEKWRAALDMAVSSPGWFWSCWDDFATAHPYDPISDRVFVAALLIKAGEVPEPVDPIEAALDEAWDSYQSIEIARLSPKDAFKAAIRSRFDLTLKDDAG